MEKHMKRTYKENISSPSIWEEVGLSEKVQCTAYTHIYKGGNILIVKENE